MNKIWFQALEVDKSINAVCDFILEASDWAEALENIPENERGPLYGIPISVKVSFILFFCIMVVRRHRLQLFQNQFKSFRIKAA